MNEVFEVKKIIKKVNYIKQKQISVFPSNYKSNDNVTISLSKKYVG